MEAILEGPDADGRFLVKWRKVDTPRWEWPAGLSHLTLMAEYCERHGIVLGKGGRPLVWRPTNLTAAQSGPATAQDGAEAKTDYIVCPVCPGRVLVHHGKQRMATHAASKKHLAALQQIALAEATAAPPDVGGAATAAASATSGTALGGADALAPSRRTPRARTQGGPP